MESNTNDVRDPGILNEDIIKCLMKHTHDMIRDEAEHTNVKIKRVIQAVADVASSVSSSKSDSDSKVADLNLKLETVISYYHHLLFSLKSGLVDTFQLVQYDMSNIQDSCFTRRINRALNYPAWLPYIITILCSNKTYS